MLTAEELHARGVAANNAGRYVAARQLLERALGAARDPELLARVESSLVHLDAETGHAPRALERCESLLVRPGLSPSTRGSVRSQRAMLLMLGGRTSEALVDFTEAIADLTDAPDFLGRALLNRGGAYLRIHDVAAAEDDFRAARPPLHQAGLEVEVAMAEHNLGYCRLLSGDLVGALHLMDRAAVVLAPLSAVSAATCDQDRAEVLLAAGIATLVALAIAAGSARFPAGW